MSNKAADRFGESTYLIVPSGDELYYLDGIELANNLTQHSRLGRREPLSGLASGLVLAAYMPGFARALRHMEADETLSDELEQVRQSGFAIEQGQYQPGLNCAAIPLWRGGEAVAGLCINGASARLPRKELLSITSVMAEMALNTSEP